MSFIREEQVNNKRVIKCKCDYCGTEFNRRYTKSFTDPNKLSFCSVECSNESKKKGERLNEKTRITNQKLYRVDNPWQSEMIKKKIRTKLIKLYGVDHPMKSERIRRNTRRTCIDKYETSSPTQSKSVKEKFKQTCIDKYGVDNPNKSKQVRNKIKETCLKKYGEICPTKNESIKKESKKTCLMKYGTEYSAQSKSVKEKYDWKTINKKCHETMKRNGTYGKSKIEDSFYEYLCKLFSIDNVERQVRINNWNIDFYIKPIDVYIQVDGVYWHGLDRNVDVIKEFKHPRDRMIYKTFLKDNEQNEWFKNNNLILVRVTDIQVEEIIRRS